MARTKRTYVSARRLEDNLTAISRTRALTEKESRALEDAIRDQGRFVGTRKRKTLHLVLG